MSLIDSPDAQRVQILSNKIQRTISEEKTAALARYLAELVVSIENIQRSIAVHEHTLRIVQLPVVRKLPTTAPTPSLVEINADWALPQSDGFYDLEYTEGGVPFRWTGPTSRFQFVLNIDRSVDRCGELVLLGSENPSVRESLRRLAVSVDGEQAALQVQEEGLAYRVAFPIASRASAAATTIVCGQAVWSPADFGSDDQRQLGVQFRKLRVSEADRQEV